MKLTFIPDVHGRLSALDAMLRACGLVQGGRWAGGEDDRLVCLGDFIDRGASSRDCVERLMRLNLQRPDRVQVLLGNHEQLLLNSVAPGAGKDERFRWSCNGGGATLDSYGDDFRRLCHPGGEHHAWLSRLPLYLELDGVLACHGGLTADNLDLADPESLLWARPPDLVKGPYKAVVSGHTPTASGRIEYGDGVYQVDICLGGPWSVGLQMLQLDTRSLEQHYIHCGYEPAVRFD